MPSGDEEREALKEGSFIAVGASAVLVVTGLLFGFPWQLSLLLAVITLALVGVLTGLTLRDTRQAAQRRAVSHAVLSAWADRNEGCFGTASTAFTGDATRWQLSASSWHRGELFALGRREGTEVGVVCSAEDTGEVLAELTTILVLLPERRPPARLRRRDISRLDLPYSVASVETNGRELSVRYEGWPRSPSMLDTMTTATIRLQPDLPTE
ncbi:hypothetical protein ACIOKD_32990 [Streptomyces sp. NPDC087844]|uniref:hypothetical protein n=1 Tax=Streptomyces sp. NPDC087844 TaxID=3365805 RepID=UPI003804A102